MNKQAKGFIEFESREDLIEYNNRINDSREKRKKYMLIETGKEIGECINIKDVDFLNAYQHPKINILSIMMNLINELDSTNMNIIEVYEIWNKLCPDGINFNNTVSNSYYISRMSKLLEYIIFDIHKFISRIISIVWIITNPSEKKFQIYDIGSYLNVRNKQINECKYNNIKFDFFDDYLEFFQYLNNFINAYKHSPTNNETIFLGRDRIVLSAVKMREDSLFKESKLYMKYLDKVVADFNVFIINSKILIDHLTKNKQFK